MNRDKQTLLLAVLGFIVYTATAAYVNAKFDSFWSREDAVGTQHIDQFGDIRNQQRDGFELKPLSTTP